MRLNRPGRLPAGGRLNAKVMSTDAHRVAEAGGIFSAKSGCLSVIEPPLDPALRNRQRLPRLIARWKEGPPAPYGLLVRPAFRDVGIETHEHVQMIVHHGKTADSHREDIRKFL